MAASADPSSSSSTEERTCARHPELLAPRDCRGCAAPLCSACARHARHRLCPTCAVAAGSAPVRADADWYAALVLDGLAHATAAKARVLLSVGGLTLALLPLALLLPSEAAGFLEESPMALAVFAALAGASLLTQLAQPALELPLRRRVPVPRRLLRASLAAVAAVGGLLAITVVLGLVGRLLVVSGLVNPLVYAVLIGVAVGLPAGTLGYATLWTLQAAYALGRRSLWSALGLPFRGGLRGLLALGAALPLVAIALSPVALVCGVPVALAVVVFPAAYAGLFGVYGVAMISAFLFCTAAVGTATLRFVEDVARS